MIHDQQAPELSELVATASKKNSRALRLLPLCLLSLMVFACAPAEDVVETRFIRQIDWIDKGQWLKVDLQAHSDQGDGGRTIDEVVVNAARYGCDAVAITDNGDQSLNTLHSVHWQSLVQARENHPGIMIIAGLEWNLPPWGRNARAIVLMPEENEEYSRLTELKERFDDQGMSTRDASRMREALEWLDNSDAPSLVGPVLFNVDPSRHVGSSSEVVQRMQDWRSINGKIVGFTGAPGRQMSDNVGEYQGPLKPIDRWDPAVGELGGAWDQLLKERHDIWGAVASSDFHRDEKLPDGRDFWPGQFAETWVYAPDRSIEGILKALKAGSFFGVHGHIAQEIELSVTHPALSRRAFAGEAIEVTPGSQIMVSINGLIPETDWTGQQNRLDQVELIVGSDDGVEVITEKLTSSSVFIVQKSLRVPPGGCTIRARGRRVIADEDDLLFYTNHVRVSVRHAHVAPEDAIQDRPGKSPRDGWHGLLAASLLFAGSSAGIWLFNLFTATMTKPSTGESTRGASRGRAWYLRVGIAWYAIMFYSSLVPFHFEMRNLTEVITELRRISLVWPTATDRTNLWIHGWMSALLTFLWLGSMLAEVDRARVKWIASVATLLLSVAAVWSWEISSTVLNGRVISHPALLADGLGCLVGVCCWLIWGERLHRWLKNYFGASQQQAQMEWLLIAYMVGLLICSMLPLDLLLTPQDVYQKFESQRILIQPFGKGSLGAQAGMFAVFSFIPVGIATSRVWVPPPGVLRSFPLSVALCVIWSFTIEFARLLAFSRVADATHILLHAMGGMIGTLLIRFPGSEEQKLLSYYLNRYQLTHYMKWNLAAVVYAIGLCLVYWWPFSVLGDTTAISQRAEQMIRWPFYVWQHASEPNPIAKLASFIPFGILLALLIDNPAITPKDRTRLSRVALVICLLFSAGLETVQIFFPPNFPDVTDVLIYAAGAWLGMRIAFKWQKSSP